MPTPDSQDAPYRVPPTAEDGWPNLIYWRDGRPPALKQLDTLIGLADAAETAPFSTEDLIDEAAESAGYTWGEIQHVRALEYLGNLTPRQVTNHGTAWIPHAARLAQDSYTESVTRARRALERGDRTYEPPPTPFPTAEDTPHLTL